MAKKIAQFFKVSFEQYKEAYLDTYGAASEEETKTVYDDIKLPERATRGSAGYDFYAPVDIRLAPAGRDCEDSEQVSA